MVVGSLSMGGLLNDYENSVTLKKQNRITVLLFSEKSDPRMKMSFTLH